MITVGFAAIWLVDSILGKLKSDSFQKKMVNIYDIIWYLIICDDIWCICMHIWWYVMYIYLYLMYMYAHVYIFDVYVCIFHDIWWYNKSPRSAGFPQGLFFSEKVTSFNLNDIFCCCLTILSRFRSKSN